MHPKAGGRVVLERELVSSDEVRYAAALYVPGAVWRGVATVTGGVVTFAAWSPAEGPPAWLVGFAAAFLRSEWKARQRPDAAPWPQRINRWREEKP